MDPDDPTHEAMGRPKRKTKLTFVGKELFEQTVTSFWNKQKKLRRKLEEEMKEKASHSKESYVLQRDRIGRLMLEYRDLHEDFMAFLERSNSDESYREKASQDLLMRSLEDKVNDFMHELDAMRKSFVDYTPKQIQVKTEPRVSPTQPKVIPDNTSARSQRTSHSSRSSSHSISLAQQRMEAEEAKAKLEYTQREAKLRKEQASIQVDLEVLGAQRDAAVAEAKLRTLENMQDCISISSQSIVGPVLEREDPMKRTRRYVEEIHQQPVESTRMLSPCRALDPFEPKHSEFTSFLLKKELMINKLVNFDDKPENFLAWKTTFKSVIQEASVSPAEELDLLIRWLGPESREHARRVKATTTHNPVRGCEALWRRLHERYGSPELVESAIRLKLAKFPRLGNNDMKKLYDLSDLLCEIKSLKDDPKQGPLFAYFDTSVGVLPILQKLTYSLQSKWTTKASKYKLLHNVSYPPFEIFCDFIEESARMLNDPGLVTKPDNPNYKPQQQNRGQQGTFSVKKTGVTETTGCSSVQKKCPIHGMGHTLNECKAFRKKSIRERKQFLREQNLCYKCCESDTHVFKSCNVSVKCTECGSVHHPTALHRPPDSQATPEQNGGERILKGGEQILSKCTAVCGAHFQGRSCAKAVLVNVYPKDDPEKCLTLYALIDDQSNATLAKPELFDFMGVPNSQAHFFTLTSCAGRVQKSGRRISNLMVATMDGSVVMEMPTITECDEISNEKHEIPTFEVIKHHAHLKDLPLPPIDPCAEILVLIGRDLLEAHHVQSQRLGPKNSPFALQLRLGWVVIGDVCLNRAHRPSNVSVYKTNVITSERQSIFQPCPNKFHLTEDDTSNHEDIGAHVFKRKADDDQVGLSLEDHQFIKIMDEGFVKDEDGRWKAPLPFRSPRPQLQNNRLQALKRAQVLDSDLKRNPIKREHMITFMKSITESGALEVAPPVPQGKECWFLPLFGVYHPRKPDRIRGVFDSSVKFEGLSLNNVLLSGPNMTNDLLGVLLRFRMNKVAIMADIEKMFYSFLVREEDRDFLRFFWYKNNDTEEDLMEYRMKVHVFGNTPSPAVATYGLRKTVEDQDEDVRKYVIRNFYVDDGLISLPTSAEAIDLLRRTQSALKKANIRLHKIVSNDVEVMEAFPSEDLEKNLMALDIGSDDLPVQQSLGLAWDINADSFTYNTHIPVKPFTKRGLLSVINSLFDPLGFIAPIVIHGRILYREMGEHNSSWDDPLPEGREKEWLEWKDSLHSLEGLHIPRMFTPLSLSCADLKELHVFSDASEKAISAVVYLRTVSSSGDIQVGFIIGKSKIAPLQSTTIPRLELCAAVLGTELAQIVIRHLDIDPDSANYYTDSKVVLGYLNNQTRRFYNYVSNRVSVIHRRSKPQQWSFVPTSQNPADIGTRCLTSVEQLAERDWLRGPPLLRSPQPDEEILTFPLISPDMDKEIRPEVNVKKTEIHTPLVTRFEHFSTWKSLVRAITNLKKICKLRKGNINSPSQSVKDTQEAELFIIRTVQAFFYEEEIKLIRDSKLLPSSSSILNLHPFIDDQDILRVGGRLNQAPLSFDEKNPIILPAKSHVAKLIVTHLHEKVYHQGRLITEGKVRSSGFWIVGCKKLVNSIIHKCVVCKKLRGKLECQRMSDLPADRVTPGPPFSAIGVDVFGPWSIVARKTRGGLSHSKRWAVLFSCLTSRAIHIEVIEEMSASSFINALRRFVSLRGPVKEIRSDRGTNFVGALDVIQAEAIYTEKGPLKDYLHDNKITWTFNPPHASHRGGSWERMIGISRKILDSMLLNPNMKQLSHEVLCTFMCEVCAIVNSRPICSVSCDPDNPYVISPSMLLTQKSFPDVLPKDSSDIKEIYKAQWKHVQHLSDTFWKRWKDGYLQHLQHRTKWQSEHPDIKVGDVVLLREKELHRGQWPMGLIVQVFKSDSDQKVRTVQVRVVRDGKDTTYIRPITELVLLID
ncbi:uncharacterized protein LOC134228483 [Saccostrea cucullata]|uniref:uncharacterized protein LOC134228483 n=1 Tax=Saccostrea cuccullata TaxID=36930 RepID=UPI002ED69211